MGRGAGGRGCLPVLHVEDNLHLILDSSNFLGRCGLWAAAESKERHGGWVALAKKGLVRVLLIFDKRRGLERELKESVGCKLITSKFHLEN